jgi:hypothetical protein
MKDVSPEQVAFFEGRLKKVQSEDKKRIFWIILVFAIIIGIYAFLFSTGVLKF